MKKRRPTAKKPKKTSKKDVWYLFVDITPATNILNLQWLPLRPRAASWKILPQLNTGFVWKQSMRYMNMSLHDAHALDEKIAGREIELDELYALNWYCFYLKIYTRSITI
jgi:hypothetical protein